MKTSRQKLTRADAFHLKHTGYVSTNATRLHLSNGDDVEGARIDIWMYLSLQVHPLLPLSILINSKNDI